jgi:hypothetical protein
MAANKELTAKKHAAVRKAFKKLCAVTTNGGKKKYTYAAIVEKLSADFYYQEKTIESIISK